MDYLFLLDGNLYLQYYGAHMGHFPIVLIWESRTTFSGLCKGQYKINW